jgi:glutamate racemase
MLQALSPISASSPANSSAPRIGVFDSGVGGLSVLRSLRNLLPNASLTYVADSGNAPYGERDDSFVAERSERIATYLLDHAQSQLLVVACNTATAAAVHRLRERWPDLPIVGVEPGLKPAVAASSRRSVGVLATPSTLGSGKFQRLLDQYGLDAKVHLQPCPGLAAAIELGDLDAAPLVAMVDEFCAPLRRAAVDVVVLGCTHYAFVEHHIAASMGRDVKIIDTADAVARHAVTRSRSLTTEPGDKTVKLYTTGDPERLDHAAKSWLTFPCVVGTRNI